MRKILTSFDVYGKGNVLLSALTLLLMFGFCTARKTPIFAPQSNVSYGPHNTPLDSAIIALEQHIVFWDSQFKSEYKDCQKQLTRSKLFQVPDAVLDTTIITRR